MADKVTVNTFIGKLAQDPKAAEIFAKLGYGKIVNAATAPGLMTVTLRDGNRVLGLSPKQMKDLLKALNDADVEG